jgi:flagellar protein FlaG
VIERISTSSNPIQQRMTIKEGAQVKKVNEVDSPSSTNLLNEKQLQQNDQNQKKKVESVIKGLNEFLRPSHTSIQFKLHEKLKEYYVVLVDDSTKEVVREIPPKKFLDMYADMAEHLGILVDKKI